MRRVLRLAPWVGALLLAGAPRLAAQAIPIAVGGQTSSLVGVAMDIPIQFDLSARSDKLGSFGLTLRWNPAVLQLQEGVDGTFGPVTVNGDSAATGMIRVTGANPAGVGGKVTVAILHFVPLTAAGDTLRLAVTEAYAAGSFADLLPSLTGGGLAQQIYCPARGRWGDVDGDSVVNSRDALLVLSSSVGLTVAGDISLGDVDANGAIGARDALVILSYAVGLPVTGFRVFGVAPGACVVPVIVGLGVDPGPVTMLPGQSAPFLATLTDASGNVTAVTDLFWHTSDNRVAVVSPSGTVQAVGVGAALISGVRVNGDSAGALVTVVPRRSMHWVDALAFNARVQIGSQALPFATWQQALDIAQPGDTLRVRGGRYSGNPTIRQSVVVLGDSTGPRPVMARDVPAAAAITIQGGSRVEIAYVETDTVGQGIRIFAGDTVVLRGILTRTGPFGDAGVVADSVHVLRVSHSQLLGTGTVFDPGLEVNNQAGVVVLDSTVVAGHGSYGVELYNVDSLAVHGSSFEGNGFEGISLEVGFFSADTAHFAAVVVTGSHFQDNGDGSLGLDGVRSVRLDHNVFSEQSAICCGTVLSLFGHGGTVISMVADSIDAGDRDWIDATPYDSLSADSLVVIERNGIGSLDGGRIAVVQHSRFSALQDEAISVSPGARDSGILVLRSVAFLGPDSASCDECAEAVSTFGVRIDADSVQGVNLDELFGMDDHNLVLRRSSLTHAFELVFNDCDGVQMDSVAVTDVRFPVEAFGACQDGDTVLVDHSSFDRAGTAIETGGLPLIVRNSLFTNVDFGLEADSSFQLINTHWTNLTSQVIDYSAGGATDTVLVQGNVIACSPTSSAFALRLYDAAITVVNNTLTDCYHAIDLGVRSFASAPVGTDVIARGNTITMPAEGDVGIVIGQGIERAHIVGNTISGPAQGGSISVGVFSDNTTPRFARVDSNTVSGAVGQGIVIRAADSLYVRDNVVLATGGGTCCDIHGAIVQSEANFTNVLRQFLRNRVSRSASHGIVLASPSFIGDTVQTLVDSNTVYQADSIGIWIQAASGALLRRNSVDSSGSDGIRVQDNNIHPAMLLRENNITRSKGYGVNQQRDETLDAEQNWWGDPLGAFSVLTGSTGDSASAFVDVTNPLNSAAGAPVAFAPRIFASLATRPSPVASPARTALIRTARRQAAAAPVDRQVTRLSAERQRLASRVSAPAPARAGTAHHTDASARALQLRNANLQLRLARLDRELARIRARAARPSQRLTGGGR